jgi:hypothetical protein
MINTFQSTPPRPLTGNNDRARWAIRCLMVLAFAAGALWLELMPTFRLEPLDLLPMVIGVQVLGALVLTAWLLWSPA